MTKKYTLREATLILRNRRLKRELTETLADVADYEKAVAGGERGG